MIRQYWPRTGKVVILILSVLAYGYIGHRLISFDHWNELAGHIQPGLPFIGFLSLLVLLWGLNLTCETKKWQKLMAPFIRLPFGKAWQQVMAGTTTAIGSPSRIAEMGGRMTLLPNGVRMHAAVMTTIGGMIQNLVIFAFGALTLLLSEKKYIHNLPFDYSLLLGGAIILILVVIVTGYFFSEKIRYYFRLLKNLKGSMLLQAFGWTMFRYVIFVVQLYVWMHLFGLNIQIEQFIVLAALYFFAITLIPSHVLVDMGIRGSVAIFLFSSAQIDTPLIIAATFCLWVSNVVFPTVVGSYILIRQKVIKQGVMKKES